MSNRFAFVFVCAMLFTAMAAWAANVQERHTRQVMRDLEACHVTRPYMVVASYEAELNDRFRDHVDAIDVQVEVNDCPYGHARVARWRKIQTGFHRPSTPSPGSTAAGRSFL